jgi:hypothetical protein
MNKALIKPGIASSTIVLLAVSLATTNPVNAAPVLTNVASLKAFAANPSIDVRWRGRGGWGPGALAAGIVAGIALGSLASSPYVYGYGSPYAYAPYGYAPGFYGYYNYIPGARFQDSFRNGY